MHSSIQFRHKATSTWGVEEIATVSDCSDATRRLQTVICAEVFFWWAEFCWGGLRHGGLGAGLQSQGRVSLERGLRVVCLLRFVSQTVSPVCPWESKVPDSYLTQLIWITLIWLLRGGPWGWRRRRGLGGPPSGPAGGPRTPRTPSPLPSS